MALDEINEVLKFYQDRGLIKGRPSNSVLSKLASKYKEIAGGSVPKEAVVPSASPRQIIGTEGVQKRLAPRAGSSAFPTVATDIVKSEEAVKALGNTVKNTEMGQVAKQIAHTPEAETLVKRSVPKQLWSKFAKAKLGTKVKILGGLFAAGVVGTKMVSDMFGDDGEAPAQEMPTQEEAVPTQQGRSGQPDPYMMALLQSMNPPKNATTSELAESLRGAAEIAKAIGAESLGSRDAIRRRMAQPTPQLRAMRR